MEVRHIPPAVGKPTTNYDPESKQHKQEVKEIFDEYKRNRQAAVAPPTPAEQPYVKQEVTIAINDVPSKMLPYPTGSSIKYRPYNYGEIQVFSSSDMSEADQLKFILDGIITEGFDKMNLAFQDFLFIAILRKLTAWDKSKFSYKFVCDECGEVNDKVSNLSEIEFKDLELPSLPLIVDVDENTALMLNPMTVGSTIKLLGVTEDRYLKAYAECVINMPVKKALEIIRNAQGDLIDVLEEADRMLGFGDQSIDCECTHCKSKNTFPLREVQNLIQPFRRTRDAVKSSIRFS